MQLNETIEATTTHIMYYYYNDLQQHYNQIQPRKNQRKIIQT